MIGILPEELTVGGEEYPIRTDYRNVLDVFEAFQNPDLSDVEKWEVAIYMMFECFSCYDDAFEAAEAGFLVEGAENGFPIDEAIKQISWFISAGQPEKQVLEQPTYNWTQDEQMIFSAVNKVAGRETRELEYLHWWTFLGYFNEVGEGTFSFIVGIRHKLNKGKKLEKHEKEFLSLNKELVLMKKPLTKEEQEQEDAYKSLLDEVLG
jgi:hypothetical protein